MMQTTRLSKAISAVLLVLFVVQYFIGDTKSYLALVPGRTLPCVWNLVTAGFLTTHPAEILVSIAGVLLLSRLVEPIYGSKEFLKFLFVVDFSVCCCVFVIVYISYAITANGVLLYTQFSGFHGVLAALLVAVKQVMPHHEAKLFGVLKIRVKYVPSILLVLVVVPLCYFLSYQYALFYVFGTYNAWVYLRFFQQQPDSNACGDASEDFKFSSFFPPLVAPIVDAVAGVFGIIFRLRHAPGSEVKVVQLNAGPSMLGSDAADANRRRERGAKALEERLGLKQQQAQQSPRQDLEAGSNAEGNSSS